MSIPGQTGVLLLNRRRPSPGCVAHLVRWLKDGSPVVAPTETQYALLADATSAAAVDTVRSIKGRSSRQPFSVFVLDAAWLPRWGIRLPSQVEVLATTFWPGPLTLVLPASNPALAQLGGRRRSIGVRVSPEPIVRRLLRELDRPLVATSANPSGRILGPAAENRWLVEQVEKGEIIWARPRRYSRHKASTVVDCTGRSPRQLRAGPIRRHEWQAVLKEGEGDGHGDSSPGTD